MLVLVAGCSTLTTPAQREFEMSRLDSIGYGLRSYFFIHGHFPSTGTNIVVLGQADPAAAGTASMAMTKKHLQEGRYPDVWGSDYVLETHARNCRVSSKGADRIQGTDDDFVLRVTPTTQSFVFPRSQTE